MAGGVNPNNKPQLTNISLDITFNYGTYTMGNTIAPIKNIPYKSTYSMNDLKKYGYDYKSTNSTSWKNVAIKNLLNPNKQFSVTQISSNYCTMTAQIQS